MGLFKKKNNQTEEEVATPPKLVRRGANHKSVIKSGRIIGERREKLETASERAAARQKIKNREKLRVILTVIGFIVVAIIITIVISSLLQGREERAEYTAEITVPPAPTIEIIDEDMGGGKISSTMREYIGRAEQDFRDLGYTPTKVVRPTGSIREVDFYLEGYTGFIKLVTDRGSSVSVEDADRMIRYLASGGTADFKYIDVRIDGKAYWKPLD